MHIRSQLSLRSPSIALLLLPVVGCGRPLVGWPLADTGVQLDATPPTVSATIPADLSAGASLNAALIVVFSEEMDMSTLVDGCVLLTGGAGEPLLGTITPTVSAVVFDPDADLLPDTEYTGAVLTTVTDLAGNNMSEVYTWTFSTGALIDVDPPRVTSTIPADWANDVDTDVTLSATFSEQMDPATISTDTFALTGPGGVGLGGVVTFDEGTHTASFDPDANLVFGTTYAGRISAAASDLAGNSMVEDYVWIFSTGALPRDLEPVDLRSLASFVAVAGAGLTTSNVLGTTTLNGDVGLSPSGTCLGDGEPCTDTNPVITYELYANDSSGVAAQAKVDLDLALTDAMGRPPGASVHDLSGETFGPGVYTSNSSLVLHAGETVTLDGGGDANAVWIFQVPSAMTIDNDAAVLLVNGANAENVFWAIGTSSSLGSNVSFQGTILAQASNSVEANSAVVGRVFASTGAVTLLSDNIALPRP